MDKVRKVMYRQNENHLDSGGEEYDDYILNIYTFLLNKSLERMKMRIKRILKIGVLCRYEKSSSPIKLFLIQSLNNANYFIDIL